TGLAGPAPPPAMPRAGRRPGVRPGRPGRAARDGAHRIAGTPGVCAVEPSAPPHPVTTRSRARRPRRDRPSRTGAERRTLTSANLPANAAGRHSSGPVRPDHGEVYEHGGCAGAVASAVWIG